MGKFFKIGLAQAFCGLTLLFSLSSFAAMTTQSIPLELPASVPGMPLKIFVTRASSWNKAAILSEMRLVNQTFSKCGFGFNEIELTTIESSTESFDKPEVMDLLGSLDKENKRFTKELSLIFLKQVKGSLAKVSPLGVSWGQDSVHAKSYASFAVITDRVLASGVRRYYAKDYSTLAHELGHILLNANHVDFKNLMASQVALLDGSLTDKQCSQINQDPYGLLAKIHKSNQLAAKTNP